MILRDRIRTMFRFRFRFRLRNPIQSVGGKLFLILFVTTVGLSAVLGIASYTVAKNLIMDKVATASSQTIVQAADKLDFMLAQYEALSRQLLVDQVLKDDLILMNQQNGDTAKKNDADFRIKRKLDALVASDPRLLRITLLPKNLDIAKAFRSANSNAIVTGPANQAWMKKIMDEDGKVVWIPSMKKGLYTLNTQPTFTMGKLLKNLKNPEAEYLLTLEIKSEALAEVLSNVKIGQNGQTMILTDDHHIVHSAVADQLESESSLLAGKEGKEEESFFANEPKGHQQLIVYKKLHTANWVLTGDAPTSDFIKETNKLLYITLAITLMAVVLAVVIGYFMVFLVGKPLNVLCTLMEQGQRGNLTVRTEFKSQDEIGRLGQSFNKMMQQISSLVEQTNASAKEVLDTATELSKVSKGTSVSAKEIAFATREIALGASNLAVEAEKGNGLTEDIGHTMAKVTQSNMYMEQAADRVKKVSEQGTAYMQVMIEKTNANERLTQSIVEKVDRLKESTYSIRKILELLNNMTKQTNILSLNAAIEASRAGAAGKGFMVVAEEVRKLADQSKASIHLVSGITEDIQREIEQTVSVLLMASPIFNEQMNSVKEAAVIFENVKEEMSGYIEQIDASSSSIGELVQSQHILSESMICVSSVVQQTTASTEEVASLSAEQLSISEKLVKLSEKLEELSDILKTSLVTFHT
ncbi:methyl-accepting chemotaxis protein [Paenibacillus sp. SI8]|uniref:methyl-accepting chemotaxis protein n=1 Tax=unclassified Paenibacillus TaxID=185978 RepID=UPI003465CE2E